MGTKINIVYSLTRNLYPQLEVTIRSAIEHNPDAMIYVLAEDDELPFRIPVEHRILNMSGQQYFPPEGPNMKNAFTYMAMLRSQTAEILPEDRAIQLDVDTIVCESLEPIWSIDMTGKWVAWCEETFGRWKPFGPKYYNFGVAVLNLEQMRADRAPEYMAKALNTVQVPFIDQDIMNMFALPDKTIALDPRWNESFCCGQSGRPGIVHYAGFPDWFTNETVPRRDYLEKYLRRSESFD